ncbi:hypothetical protein A4X13_0g2576 [Tilletia indica]|uniref:Uncharacterized protein n=1 Tax=Tilletia indica TaxID=43049 RepID=A0A177TYK3_9BASI|nr:hypothetical protein A4X13_0g2576 [Tilletia indica]
MSRKSRLCGGRRRSLQRRLRRILYPSPPSLQWSKRTSNPCSSISKLLRVRYLSDTSCWARTHSTSRPRRRTTGEGLRL